MNLNEAEIIGHLPDKLEHAERWRTDALAILERQAEAEGKHLANTQEVASLRSQLEYVRGLRKLLSGASGDE